MGINNHIELVRRLCSNRTGATARGQTLWGFSRHLGSVFSTAPKQPSRACLECGIFFLFLCFFCEIELISPAFQTGP